MFSGTCSKNGFARFLLSKVNLSYCCLGLVRKKSSITQESIIAQQQKQHVQGMFGFQPCREGKENISA